VKGIVIVILMVVVAGISLIFQPWSELGFCLDPNDITKASMLGPHLKTLANTYDAMGMKDLGQKLQDQTITGLNEEAKENGLKQPDPDWKNPVLSGDYAYVYFMSFSLLLAAIAIMLIGREDAEEKLILPVKK
jgi:hypothetical protein